MPEENETEIAYTENFEVFKWNRETQDYEPSYQRNYKTCPVCNTSHINELFINFEATYICYECDAEWRADYGNDIIN